MTGNVMFVGVGGQGTLLASRVLGHVLTQRGLDVKVSEVHGMSQRGGSVVTYVRYGESVASPLIEAGGADVIVAFERLEALRWLPYLAPGGVIIVNDLRIDPMPVITGTVEYPRDIDERLRQSGARVVFISATDIALSAGNIKAANIALMGALCSLAGFERDEFERAIAATVPQKALDVNIKAFALGIAAAADCDK